MHQVILRMLAITVFSQPPVYSSKIAGIRAMVSAIRSARLGILEDSTRVDFCDIDDLWTPDGRFVAPAEIDGLLRYTSKAECNARSSTETRQVRVLTLSIKGNEVIATSVTKKNGSRYSEQYELSGALSGKFCCAQYRVTGEISK